MTKQDIYNKFEKLISNCIESQGDDVHVERLFSFMRKSMSMNISEDMSLTYFTDLMFNEIIDELSDGRRLEWVNTRPKRQSLTEHHELPAVNIKSFLLTSKVLSQFGYSNQISSFTIPHIVKGVLGKSVPFALKCAKCKGWHTLLACPNCLHGTLRFEFRGGTGFLYHEDPFVFSCVKCNTDIETWNCLSCNCENFYSNKKANSIYFLQ